MKTLSFISSLVLSLSLSTNVFANFLITVTGQNTQAVMLRIYNNAGVEIDTGPQCASINNVPLPGYIRFNPENTNIYISATVDPRCGVTPLVAVTPNLANVIYSNCYAPNSYASGLTLTTPTSFPYTSPPSC